MQHDEFYSAAASVPKKAEEARVCRLKALALPQNFDEVDVRSLCEGKHLVSLEMRSGNLVKEGELPSADLIVKESARASKGSVYEELRERFSEMGIDLVQREEGTHGLRKAEDVEESGISPAYVKLGQVKSKRTA